MGASREPEAHILNPFLLEDFQRRARLSEGFQGSDRGCRSVQFSSVQFSYYINNRQPNGSLSNVLSRLAVEVRVDGDDETQRKEHEREGDQEETRHRVLACVPSEYK